MKKRVLSLALALALCLTFAVSVSAEEHNGSIQQVGDFLIQDGTTLVRYIGSDEIVTIPDGITTIAAHALSSCSELTSVSIPDSVSFIGDYAFYSCTNLKRVVFPAADVAAPTLQNINIHSVFSLCAALEEIINCPVPAFYERLAANHMIWAAWTGSKPDACITPQSERITAQSNQICAGLTSDYDKAKAVYDWMTANIAYNYDWIESKKGELTYMPEEVLDSKLTICEGYTRLTQALLHAQGIPTLFVDGFTYTADGRGSHAWNMVFADGRWIYLDTTWGCSLSTSAWFDPSELCLSLSHKGSRSFIDRDGSPLGDTPTSFSATPTRSTVLVNGTSVPFDAYNIGDNNYFKLRDLAQVLSGTGKQFEVTWDGTNNAINLLSGKPYTTVGGELAAGNGTGKTASLTNSTVYLDGSPVVLTAFNISDNNYFKLRDIGAAFDFNVTWDGTRNTIVIDTTQSYTPD